MAASHPLGVTCAAVSLSVIPDGARGEGDSWLKVGVRDPMDCLASDTANLFVIGSGTAIQPGTARSTVPVRIQVK